MKEQNSFTHFVIGAKTINQIRVVFSRDLAENTYFVGQYEQPSGKCIKLKEYKTYNGASKYYDSLKRQEV